MEDTPQNVASRGRVPLHVDEQGNSSQDPEFPEVGSPRSDPRTSDSGESDVDTVEKAGTRNQARAGSSTMDQDKDKDKKEESTARNQARRERTQHGSSAGKRTRVTCELNMAPARPGKRQQPRSQPICITCYSTLHLPCNKV